MNSIPSETYDFIVVGAGASGCTLASRLARSAKRPSVLLVEAGGENEDKAFKVDAEKWIHRMNPSTAWGYNTVPQKHCNDRVIAYDRGKGLGGSTSINFSVYNIGPRDDFDEIARLVGDDEWKWENAQQRLKNLESYFGTTPDIPEGSEGYLNPQPDDHGTKGPLKIGFPGVWEKSCKEVTDIFVNAGFSLNPDLNSGNPLGLSVAPASAYKGVRTQASDILIDPPNNLKVLTDTQTARILFSSSSKTAIGISTLTGSTFHANKEVILSAGSLDTPKLLLLSGIGSAPELAKLNIPLFYNSPFVGKGMKDHHHIAPTWIRAPHTTIRHTYYASDDLQSAARKQWEENQTGPLSEICCTMTAGFFKSNSIYASPEFQALPEEKKTHLLKPTVPSYEILLNGPVAEYFMDPKIGKPLQAIWIFLFNMQGVGSVTLQSSDPAQPALYDPNFFSHPYDRRAAVEATREVLKVVEKEGFKKDTVGLLHGPKSEDEEEILSYWRETTGSTWHMTGTCKMGNEGEQEGVVVDNKFRVIGVKGLRVADMSVVPIMPNNHTQTTAYCIGATAGDKIAREYGLDEA